MARTASALTFSRWTPARLTMDKKLLIFIGVLLAGAAVWFGRELFTDPGEPPVADGAPKPADFEPKIEKLAPQTRPTAAVPVTPKMPTSEQKAPVAEAGPGTKLVGRAIDRDQKPVADANIVLFQFKQARMAPEGKQKVGFTEEVRAEAKTRADGTYEFAELQDIPGPHLSMRIEKEGFVAILKDRVGPGMTVDFHMTPGYKISGIITDVDSRKPIEGVTIELTQKRNAETLHDYFRWRAVAKTDSQGLYEIQGAPEGEVTALLDHVDYEQTYFGSESKSFVSGTGPNRLDFSMKHGLVFEGTVVDSTNQKPIPGADVMLRDVILPADRQATGALGKFKMNGVKRGARRVEIRAEGYSRFNEQLDFNDQDMAKPITFALKPCGTASGTVVDLSGAPVAGAEVYVAEKMALFMKVRNLAEAKTDERGKFLVSNLNDGDSYVVACSAPGLTIGSSTAFEAASGQDISDIIVQLEPGARLQGKVTDELGVPVADMHVTIEQPPYANAWFPPGLTIGQKQTFTVTTDASGIYSVQGLYPGVYFITPDHPTYIAVPPRRFQITTSNESINQDFSLKAGHSISGQVKDHFGAPVSGATVTAALSMGDNRKIVATTDAKGEYVLQRLQDQPYRVRAESEKAVAPAQSEVPSDSSNVNFVLEPYGRMLGRVVSQTDGRPVTKFKVKILPMPERRGEKTDVESPEVRKKMFTSEAFMDREIVSNSGEFTIEKVFPGEYIVEVTSETHREREADRILVRPGDDTQVPVFLLDEGARFEGSIRDTAGNPVPAGKVQIRVSATPDSLRRTEIGPNGEPQRRVIQNVWGGRDGTVNEEGFFSIAGLPPGQVRVSFTSVDFCCPEPQEMSFERTVKKQDYVLKRAAKVLYKVTDEDGKGVSTLSATVSRTDGTRATVDGRPVVGRGDGAGVLRIEKLEPGTYTLLLHRHGYEPYQTTVSVHEGEEVVGDITLQALR
jgi:hypothetical protein